MVGTFGPSAGAAYQVMSFASATGQFATVDSPLFHGGDFFQVQTNPGNVTLTTSTAVADLALTGATLPDEHRPARPAGDRRLPGAGPRPGNPGQRLDRFDLPHDRHDPRLVGGAAGAGHAQRRRGRGRAVLGTLTALLPPVLPGTYNVLVEVDSRGLVPDGNRANNVGAAATTLQTSLPTLTVAAPATTPTAATGTVSDGEELVFQVTLAAGEVVQIAASTGAAGGVELLAGLGAIPTEADATAQAFAPGQAQQQLTLTASQAGTYDIVLVGQPVRSNGTSFSLTAQQLPFLLNAVSPTSVGNTGPVTLTITGGELAATDTFALVRPGGASIAASSVQAQGGSTIYATFDLTGAATGTYNLRATSPSAQVVSLPGAVTVQPGQAGTLSTHVQVPSAQRIGRPANGVISLENTGNVDMPAPLFVISSSDPELLLSLTGAANLSPNTVLVVGTSPTGPAGILQPGELVQIPFQEQAIEAGGDPRPDGDSDDGSGGSGGPPVFSVQLGFETVDSSDPVDYPGLAQSLGLSPSDPIMQAIQTDAGPDWGGLITLLDHAATEACCNGVAIPTASNVLEQLVNDMTFQVDGGVSGQVLLNDASHPLADALVTLATADGSQAVAGETDVNGDFRIPQVAPGVYNVTVGGYLVAQPLQVTVPASGLLTGVSVTVSQGGIISGTVTESGDAGPIDSAQVTAIAPGHLVHDPDRRRRDLRVHRTAGRDLHDHGQRSQLRRSNVAAGLDRQFSGRQRRRPGARPRRELAGNGGRRGRRLGGCAGHRHRRG